MKTQLKKYSIALFVALSCATNIQATTVYLWRLFCNTENVFVYTWREEAPTVCPNVTGPPHTINTASISTFGELSENLVRIQDETVPTGRNFKAETIHVNVTVGPDVITTLVKSWPYPISLENFSFATDTDHEGDFLTIELPSQLLIGAITQNVTASDTVINVTQDVIDNVAIGFSLILTDGTNTDDIGFITAIDDTNNQVTVTVGATNSFLAATPTTVLLTVYALKDYEIGPPARRIFGSDVIGTLHIPTGLAIKASYLNKSSSAKTLIFEYEYMY